MDRIAQHRVTPADRERIRSAAARVLAQHSWIKAAFLYGSALRDDRPARDIDIGLVAEPYPPPSDEALIAAELARESGISAIDFDVRCVNMGSPVFLHHFLRECLLVYEADREARLRFTVRALSAWLDFRPAWERVRAEVLRRWSRG